MKVFMALEVLALLAVLFWPCSGDIDVELQCSLDWMMVFVSPASSNRTNPYVYSDELVLGLGCPATKIHTYRYDFIYPVSDCGIRMKVISENILHFESSMHYTPRNIHCEPQTIPLLCSASRKSPWITALTPDEDPKVNVSPFMTDFEATPEELGLLNFHQVASSWKKKWEQC